MVKEFKQLEHLKNELLKDIGKNIKTNNKYPIRTKKILCPINLIV